MEQAIVRELERILLLLRIGSYVGTLVIFWSTPMPWKLFVMAPFVLGPVLALVLPRLPDGPAPAVEAERARVRAALGAEPAPDRVPSPAPGTASRPATS